MSSVARLDPDALCWRCDPAWFSFRTTGELEEFREILGQTRAIDAVQFGIDIRHDGFNLYVLGPHGLGKRTVVSQFLASAAALQPVPQDWCYVNNFSDWRQPVALPVPAGRGKVLRADMEDLTSDLATSVRLALESDEHKNRIRELEQVEEQRERTAFQEVAERALSEKIQLIRTPSGFVLAPLRNGEVLAPEEFENLPDPDKQQIRQTIEALETQLQAVIEKMPVWHKEIRDKLRKLNRETVNLAMGHLLENIKTKYADLPAVREYLEAVERDIVKRVDDLPAGEDGQQLMPGLPHQPQQQAFGEYSINLLVDNSERQGAPVIYEDHPTYHNLLGRVEHEQQLGALVTDFSLIKAGALHHANGGYLVVDAQRLLMQPFAWEALKRALFARSLKMESLAETLSLVSTVSLEPQAIPLDVKVVLLGDREVYYLLYSLDADFRELFKVTADFDDRFPRSRENCQLYARFLATLAQRDQLRALTPAAVARVLEHAARHAEHSQKLSLHFRTMSDTLREADYWASKSGAEWIDGDHIGQALDKQRYRADRLRQELHEEFLDGTLLLDTQGTKTGQINGLSVLDIGDTRFGIPSRITATIRLGRGEIVDIEREVKLGGAIHSKGVLILSSFLAARFGQREPLAISASLAFEQSYHLVEGDSASVAELCALLSAIAETPLRQDLAVTGSVNQHGQVQPIGGVNEKIEGFFEICREQGLTGTQGVVIPQANCKHLMLRRDVVEAAAAGQFHVYPVAHVDEALELLTGLPAGTADEAGAYPEGSLQHAVAARLKHFGQLRRKLSVRDKGNNSISEERNHE